MTLNAGQRALVSLLRRFCRDPARVPAREAPGGYSRDQAVATLRRVDPHFLEDIRGRSVVDFGCGHGHQSAAFLQLGAGRLLCLEISGPRLEDTRALCRKLGLDDGRAVFASSVSPELQGKFDLVFSQDAMEHYADPAGALAAMKSLLKPGGEAIITFGPPWYAPYGAHHQFFCFLPWAHLIFGEKLMMAARSAYRADGCLKYADVDGGLNQMSLRKFEALIAESGLRIRSRRYETVKKLRLVSSLPILRELLVNHVTVRLEQR